MNWADVGQIVVATIASAGGVGGITYAVICFSANQIAERLAEKYKAQLSHELEKYKSELSKKAYVTKTRFDTEFEIYRALTGSFWRMAKTVSQLIPVGSIYMSQDVERNQLWDSRKKEAYAATVTAQDTLNENTAFIPKEYVEQFDAILKIALTQNHRAAACQVPWEKEALEKYVPDTKEMLESMERVNDDIRTYLNKLDVI